MSQAHCLLLRVLAEQGGSGRVGPKAHLDLIKKKKKKNSRPPLMTDGLSCLLTVYIGHYHSWADSFLNLHIQSSVPASPYPCCSGISQGGNSRTEQGHLCRTQHPRRAPMAIVVVWGFPRATSSPWVLSVKKKK